MNELTEALRARAAQLLTDYFRDWLQPGETVSVSGFSEQEGAEVAVHVDAPTSGVRVETVVRVPVPAGAPDPATAVDRALDAAQAFLGEWLEAGRSARPPVEPTRMLHQGQPVWVGLRVRRPDLEAEADRLLGGD